jgi:cytochrome c-type biogenesis protein
LSISLGAAPQVILLLIGYTLGIGIPFLALALAMDGSARLTRPFLRHGRAIELIGGGLVVLIGVLIVFDLISVLSRAFVSFWPQV